MSCHVMSCRLVTWHRFVQCQVASPLLTSCLVRLRASCRVLTSRVRVVVVSDRVISSHVMFGSSSRVLSCLLFSYNVCPVVLGHVMCCHVVLHHVIEGDERREEERGERR